MTKTATLVVPTTTLLTDSATAATPFVWSISGSDGSSFSPQTPDPTVTLPGLTEGVSFSGTVSKAGLQLGISFTVPTDAPPPPPPDQIPTMVPDVTQAVQVSFT